MVEATDRAVAAAYSSTGAAWQAGPGRIYDVLARVLVEASGVSWHGRRVLDAGAGTGAATRALRAAGAEVVAADVAHGMVTELVAIAPSCVADLRQLPFTTGSLDGYVAAFSLNHLRDPATALREATRVLRPGAALVASAYADDDTHPVKDAVDAAAGELGWRAPPFLEGFRRDAAPLLATEDSAIAVARGAGLQEATARRLEVDFGELDPADLVAWRLGMAQVAPFVAGLDAEDRSRLTRRSLELLGDAPPLVRRMVVLQATP